jgi:hypothetical protein
MFLSRIPKAPLPAVGPRRATEWAGYTVFHLVQNLLAKWVQQPTSMYWSNAVEVVPVSVVCAVSSLRISIGRSRWWLVMAQYQLEVIAHPSRVILTLSCDSILCLCSSGSHHPAVASVSNFQL